jgi:hypothetical protein
VDHGAPEHEVRPAPVHRLQGELKSDRETNEYSGDLTYATVTSLALISAN